MSTISILSQQNSKDKTPMLHRFLFETWAGEKLLVWLEQRGLAIERADWLAEQRG